MGTVYVFFADGFEEIEAFTSVDVLRRADLKVEMISVTPDEIVRYPAKECKVNIWTSLT